MIRSLYHVPGQPIRKQIPTKGFPELIQNPQGLLWVDFVGEPPETSHPILQGFQFHQLAISDALQEIHVPKLDDWGDYLYIVFNHMEVEESGDSWNTQVDELDIFLGKNYVITHHDHIVSAVDETWQECDHYGRELQEGAAHLLYRIADNLVARYMPTVERIDFAIDEIEDEVLGSPSPGTLERLYGLKRVLVAMRRILFPQREVLSNLARHDYKVIDPKERIFFGDIYQRTDQIRNEILRLENETNRVLSLQPTSTQPFLTKLTNTVRKMMESPSSVQNKPIDSSTSIQTRTIYEKHSVFISYRRADSNDVTGRIYDKLVSHFGEEAVFKDVDNIPLGSNFIHELEKALRTCKVVLVIIGKEWVTIAEPDGLRRLDNPEDFVRIEIETSLAQRKPIIPVLVQGAEMPSKRDLPPSLAQLTDHNGLLVRPDPDFHNDIRRLISHMERWLKAEPN